MFGKLNLKTNVELRLLKHVLESINILKVSLRLHTSTDVYSCLSYCREIISTP